MAKPTLEERLEQALDALDEQKKIIADQSATIGTLKSAKVTASTPVTRASLSRIKQIVAAAKARPEPTNHVEPGYAIIKTRGGKSRKMIELSMVMGHTCEVSADGQTVRAGGRWDELLAGLFVLEQYAPYPTEAIVNGHPTYFNPPDEKYKACDGVFYHPSMGEKQMNAYMAAKKTGASGSA